MLKCPKMVKCTKRMYRSMEVKMLFDIIGASYLFFSDYIFLLHCTLNYLACEILQAASCSKTNANFKLLVVHTPGWDLLSHF